MPRKATGRKEDLSGNRPELIRRLSSPGFWPGLTDAPVLLETHVSWVILAGNRAYKIKKPVQFSFVDFSSLDAREAACHEEIRLNRRLAPGLYQRVMPIGGSPEDPRLDTTPAIEFAVVMHRFPQSARLDRRLAGGQLSGEDVRKAARMIAAFHASLDPAPAFSPWGTVAAVIEPFADTLRDLGEGTQARWSGRLDELERRLGRHIEARKSRGRVRECHGDLHLANLIELDGRIVAFDCLEFAPDLRWIDVINEAAFPFMDLRAHDAEGLAWEFIDEYVLASGDYDGLALLAFYAAYHAFVRAKIAKLSADRDTSSRYLAVGGRSLMPGLGALVLMHGFSGSGKTTVSDALIGNLPAVRVRSDVERKRLSGLAPNAATGSPVGGGIYSPAGSRQTYERLLALASPGVLAGVNVIVDAAFLARWQRQLFARAARDAGFPLLLVDCTAPARVLESRVRGRAHAGTGASEADLAVLGHQLEHADPLREDEGFVRIAIDTAAALDVPAVVARLRSHGARA